MSEKTANININKFNLCIYKYIYQSKYTEKRSWGKILGNGNTGNGNTGKRKYWKTEILEKGNTGKRKY